MAKWRELSAVIWVFDLDKNKEIEGVVEGFEPFSDGEFGECLKYILTTDEYGRISFIGGTAFDKLFEAQGIVNGDLIKVVYEGKKEIKGGRKVNLFHLYVDEETWEKNHGKIPSGKGDESPGKVRKQGKDK